jgi:hypothetical protein
MLRLDPPAVRARAMIGPGVDLGWRGPAGGLFSAVAMPLECVGLLACDHDGGLDKMVWSKTPLWSAGLDLRAGT